MKGDVFFVFIILSFILFNQFVSSENITNSMTGNMVVDPVTGKLTSQQVAMSIFVQAVVPYIELISPKNQTYLKNESISLNYTLINGDYVWYNLDNSENITISSSIYINVSQGEHTLYIFSNNSNASTTSSITFTANSSKFIILFENYKDNTKGSSTDFLNYTYEEIQNLENITFENTNYGKINFNEAINMTRDNISTDNLLNLDSNTEISSNHIEINSTELSNFNKSATLWIYSLNFTNPRILKDGIVCPSTICTKESYTGNTLKFNVTGFSVYSAEETPSGESSIPPSRGGGKTIKEKNFKITPEEIQISITQGETSSRNIIITNLENQRLKFELNNTFLKDFIRMNETEFYINGKESKEIKVDFIVSEDTLPDLYIGKIIATAGKTQKEILIAIEVESKSSLFDIKMNIPDKFQYVLPGEEILAQIDLYNLGSQGKTDASLDYIIKDSNGNEIVHEHDTFAVETSVSLIKRIKLPENLAFGKYILYTKVTYDGKVASASALFNVGEEELNKPQMFLYILVLILIIAVLIIIYEIRKIKKYLKPIYKVDENLLVKKGLVKIKG